MVRFDIRETPAQSAEDEKWFFRVVRAAFQQRRKTLCNSVSATLGIGKASVSEAAVSAGLDPAVRPEAMTIEQMLLFAAKLKATANA